MYTVDISAYVFNMRGIFVSFSVFIMEKQHDFISARGSQPQITVNRVCVCVYLSLEACTCTTVGCAAAVCVCVTCVCRFQCKSSVCRLELLNISHLQRDGGINVPGLFLSLRSLCECLICRLCAAHVLYRVLCQGIVSITMPSKRVLFQQLFSLCLQSLAGKKMENTLLD